MFSLTRCCILLPLLASIVNNVSSLMCYSCVSTQPGCTMEKVNWLIHSAVTCPHTNDKCVKIIERRGANERIIRDCLSQVMPYRDDIPADHFEGCRPASQMPNKAVYVDNTINELNIRNDPRNNVTFCFCEFDQWCNGSISISALAYTWLPLLVCFTAHFCYSMMA